MWHMGREFLHVLLWHVARLGSLTVQEGHKDANLQHVHKLFVERLIEHFSVGKAHIEDLTLVL